MIPVAEGTVGAFSRCTSPAECIEAARVVFQVDLSADNSEEDTMDTFGNVVDKLITVNMKMWHTQETLYEIRRMTPDQFEAKFGNDLKGLHELLARACNLNVQRSHLMDEIDSLLVQAIRGSSKTDLEATLTRPQHKMY
jgi:hypothetical protein